MKSIICTIGILIFLFQINLSAATLRGSVTSAKTGEALPNANILLMKTDFGTATDELGNFMIADLPTGTYRLKVSYIGYFSQEQNVTVQEGVDNVFYFALKVNPFQSERIVVTATRTPHVFEDVPVFTELITSDEIREKGAANLADALEYRPGLTIMTGTSGEKTINMNGMDQKRILVLVDGFPVSGKLSDRNNLSLIDANKIEQIEIVKGPGSALYGSEAMGGVINVITKKTRDLDFQVNGQYGSFGLFNGDLTLAGGRENLEAQLSYGYQVQGEISATEEIKILDSESNRISGRLGYESQALGQFDLCTDFRWDALASETFYMGSLNLNNSTISNYNSHLMWNHSWSQLEARISGFISGSERQYETRVFDSSEPASIDTTIDQIIGLKSDFLIKWHPVVDLVAGFDISNQQYNNARLASIQERNQLGAFTQLNLKPFSRLLLSLGSRVDYLTDLKEVVITPSLNIMYKLTPRLKLRGNWGTGFRVPSFIELYTDFMIPISGMPLRIEGNPDLKPEQSMGGNLGLEYYFLDRVMLNISGFYNHFTNLITDYQKAPLTFSYINVEDATFVGGEFQARLILLSHLNASFSYNYTDTQTKEEEVAVSKISPHTVALYLTWKPLQNLNLSVREQFFSTRQVLVASSGHGGGYEKLSKDAYHVLDLSATYQLSRHLTIGLGVNNCLDYIDESFGPYIGRRFFISLSAEM
jgi:outer membrane receptor for ferrienterochelin and colicins